jgi:hypothetical protein
VYQKSEFAALGCHCAYCIAGSVHQGTLVETNHKLEWMQHAGTEHNLKARSAKQTRTVASNHAFVPGAILTGNGVS